MNVVNLSRVDPIQLELCGLNREKDEKYKYIFYRGEVKPALCFCLAVIMEDFSKQLVSNGSGVASKFVSAIPLTFEYERMVAATSVVIGARTFRSQITDNELVFSTRPDTSKLKTNGELKDYFSWFGADLI